MLSFYGNSGGKASAATSAVSMYICGENEYDKTSGLPIITNPQENTIYLVPALDTEDNNTFTEYYYKNDSWELLGSSGAVTMNFDDIPVSESNNAVKSGGLYDYIRVIPGSAEGSSQVRDTGS